MTEVPLWLAPNRGAKRSLLRFLPMRARLLAPFVLAGVARVPISPTVQAAAELIRAHCDPYLLHAVSESHQFLYRGEDMSSNDLIRSPAPDLLLPDTYGSMDAVAYFTRLEREMSAITFVRPSNGHIAIADASAAAVWGEAASVWPLGKLHFAYPTRRREFFPSGGRPASSLGGVDALVLDTDLESALRTGREVMFATEDRPAAAPTRKHSGSADRTSAFVAVRASADDELRALLFPDAVPPSAREQGGGRTQQLR